MGLVSVGVIRAKDRGRRRSEGELRGARHVEACVEVREDAVGVAEVREVKMELI
jgi:hypothetical protein